MIDIETPGARLHVERWSPGEGSGRSTAIPAILLHGFTHTGETWDETARLLGREALAPDIRGHGRTEVLDRRYDHACVVDDLVCLLDTIGVDRAHLVGYSMGGRLAIAAALQHPARWASLSLLSADPGIEDAGARAARAASDDELAARIETEGVEAFARWWAALPLFAGLARRPDSVRRRLAGIREGQSAGPLAAALRGMSVGRQPDHWPAIMTLEVPLLVLAGEDDEKYAAIARRIGATNAGASIHVLAGTGHAVHLERPERVSAEIRGHMAIQR